MGIATQDPELRKNFKGKPEHIVNFLTFLAMEVREYMAKLGFRTINEMIGRVDKIDIKDKSDHWKAKGIDLSKILYKPDMPSRIKPYCTKKQDHGIKNALDYKLIKIAQNALYDNKKVVANFEIKNVDRAVGAMISGKIAKIYGNVGLAEDTICFNFKGSAGQSFGAFGAHGLTLTLEGEANDYVGKGLSGAKIIIKTPEKATFKQDENVIAGNTILYGATEGSLYVNGVVGERFAVRNSGAIAVVEGVGDHCCEYMTGGTVVVIGKRGRNFAAGMSGGIAYVIDEDASIFNTIKNSELHIGELNQEDSKVVFNMISDHYNYTGSKRAKKLLENWNESLKLFKKIIPIAYKVILEKNKNVASKLRA
jgi:glutamate synthase (NADPH/NADH) large chain